MMNLRILVLLLTMLAVGTRAVAQAPTSAVPTLQAEITAADSALFAAFNQRDLAKVMSFFTGDLEFYQDNEGVASYAQTKTDFGQMFGQAAPIRRDLVAGSLQVYPIKNYGAMEIGRHRFCHVENGTEQCATFSFVHIWRRTNSRWQIARVISYGH